MLESLFDKVACLKRLHHKCALMIFLKFLRAPYNKTPYATKIAYGKSLSINYPIPDEII